MNLIAKFPAGVDAITVHGLTQWDYGRKLRIESAVLPAIVEVHFACQGMQEAVVRVCEGLAGVAEVNIPDSCLEQATPVLAWVYVSDGTEGATVLTITLPVTKRTRPQPAPTEPENFPDLYKQLEAAVNAQVSALQAGNVLVSNAQRAESAHWADNALYAESAERATRAETSDSADFALTAEQADRATTADKATVISTSWESINGGSVVNVSDGAVFATDNALQSGATYLFRVQAYGTKYSATVMLTLGTGQHSRSSKSNLNVQLSTGNLSAEIYIEYQTLNNGSLMIRAFDSQNPSTPITESFNIWVHYKRIA